MSGYRRAPGVAAVEHGDAVFVAVLPDGPIAVLGGVAGVIWKEACVEPGAAVVERVAAVTDSASADIRDEVESFLRELVLHGLLTVRDA